MKKVIFACIALFFLLASPAGVRADDSCDTNGTAGFYGVYEYPKDQPPADDTSSDPASSDPAGEASVTGAASVLPSYEGKGQIIPLAGDRSSSATSVIGIILLAVVAYRLKRGGDSTEENGYSPRR